MEEITPSSTLTRSQGGHAGQWAEIQYEALVSTVPLDLTLNWLGQANWATELSHRYGYGSHLNLARGRIHLTPPPDSMLQLMHLMCCAAHRTFWASACVAVVPMASNAGCTIRRRTAPSTGQQSSHTMHPRTALRQTARFPPSAW